MRKGLTLIEVLVAVSVILLTAGLGLASWTRFTRQKKLTEAVRLTTVLIEETKKNAQTGAAPSTCANKTLNGWQIQFQNGRQIKMAAVCDGTSFLVKTKTLPSDITLSPNTTILFYSPPQLGTNLTTAQTLTLSLGDESKQIIIDPLGNIKVQ